MLPKTRYLIAGCNGAGKTTASFTLLPEVLDCREFVNTGGHYIAPNVTERRYWQGLHLLFTAYLPLIDEAMLFANSSGEHVLLARKLSTGF